MEAKWYRKAAEQGNARGQYILGDCYVRSHGVKQDYREVAKWYMKAASQGNTTKAFT
ncbi:sel1 repeat family protein [Megasphaera sp. SW808]|uniref:tetratricopeptide repeat protein n=1 Tax=Megasphaera sp. SW808 TaxID=2530045 RepID=UPI00143A18EF|nr:SEL1-like repeat protein [Megasphaera sp. SW808]NJE35519.1 sel1 repeat family protein [Megasphaera sp. SW808]